MVLLAWRNKDHNKQHNKICILYNTLYKAAELKFTFSPDVKMEVALLL